MCMWACVCERVCVRETESEKESTPVCTCACVLNVCMCICACEHLFMRVRVWDLIHLCPSLGACVCKHVNMRARANVRIYDMYMFYTLSHTRTISVHGFELFLSAFLKLPLFFFIFTRLCLRLFCCDLLILFAQNLLQMVVCTHTHTHTHTHTRGKAQRPVSSDYTWLTQRAKQDWISPAWSIQNTKNPRSVLLSRDCPTLLWIWGQTPGWVGSWGRGRVCLWRPFSRPLAPVCTFSHTHTHTRLLMYV